MSYLKDVEAELVAKLSDTKDTAVLVRWITEKILESYRNGIKAGRTGTVVKRDGKSRRRDSFGNTE